MAKMSSVKAMVIVLFVAYLRLIRAFHLPMEASRPTKGKEAHVLYQSAQHDSSSSNEFAPPSEIIADDLGVRRGSNAPRWIWRYSWRIHGYSLPFLHAFDQARSQDLDFALKCLWCKALSGLDETSPTFDRGLAYDMLPSGTRRILRLPNRIFPRLIHFNIELRTAYLDRGLWDEIEQFSTKKIRLVTIGAGYDVRSVRFLTMGQIQEAWELDVLPVVRSKQNMLERLKGRRYREGSPVKFLRLVVQDLNDVAGFRSLISNIVASDNVNGEAWHNIFLMEGVLIYLDDGVPRSLLSCCSSVLKKEDVSGSIVFADLFRDLPNSDARNATDFFQCLGWDLVETTWCVKPGLARHMGTARDSSKTKGNGKG